jgi:hypothetical protein
MNVHTSSKTCFVLGNGPSLDVDLSQGLDLFCSNDTFCVNQFAESDLYKKIQPNYYIIADPGYWKKNVSDNNVAIRNRLIQNVLEKTTWPIKFLVPFQAKDLFETVFKEKPNIQVVCYNNVPLSGANIVINKLFDFGLGNPRAQNVLIPALFYAIRYGYQKIILLGADHSWHETVVLDDDNRVCMRDKHFYNKEAKLTPWSMGGQDGKLFTMDSLFLALSRMFAGYWKIQDYATYRGVQIYNASSVTYVDAFKRIHHTDVAKVLTNSAVPNSNTFSTLAK